MSTAIAVRNISPPPDNWRRLFGALLVYLTDSRGGQLRFLLSIGGSHQLMSLRSDLHGFTLRVSEFLAEVVARIEPGAQSLRLSRRCFPELKLSLAGWFQPVVL